MSFEWEHNVEFIEQILVETREHRWVTLSLGGCGILTRAFIGRHALVYNEAQRIGMRFAQQVMQGLVNVPPEERLPTPQILEEAAEAVIEDPGHVFFFVTTWCARPEGIEVCSIGVATVLVLEGGQVREVVPSSERLAQLRQIGDPYQLQVWYLLGDALGARRNRQQGLHRDPIECVTIPLTPATTVAIVTDRRLAAAILKQQVGREQLLSFIKTWPFPAGKYRTCVLLSSSE